MKDKVEIVALNLHSHIARVSELWNALLPHYSIAPNRLFHLLQDARGCHFVAQMVRQPINKDGSTIQTNLDDQSGTANVIGFVATHIDKDTFTSEERKGHVSISFVDADHQNHGIGTKLLEFAYDKLICTHQCNRVVLGSVFPRFWPGLPNDIPQESKDFIQNFFRKRNESLSLFAVEACRDLYLDLEPYSSPESVVKRATIAGLKFSPLTEDGIDECMRKQWQNFDNAGWVAAYEKLISQGLSNQIMVAFDSESQQVGWTLMIERDMPVWDTLAFPPLLGANTGLIACVGVEKQARGYGIGLALVDSAVRDLKRRGMDHVFVDWVVLEGWYEKLGFKTWRDYQTLEWKVK